MTGEICVSGRGPLKFYSVYPVNFMTLYQ